MKTPSIGAPLHQFQSETVEALMGLYLLPLEVTASRNVSRERILLVDSTAGNVTLTLPDARNNAGLTVVAKKTVAANSMILSSADNIDGAGTQSETDQYAVLRVISDGETWWKW